MQKCLATNYRASINHWPRDPSQEKEKKWPMIVLSIVKKDVYTKHQKNCDFLLRSKNFKY